jgi:PAS domain S-box-containing protein
MKSEDIIESFSEPTLIVNLEGEIENINKLAVQLFAQLKDNLIGQNLFIYLISNKNDLSHFLISENEINQDFSFKIGDAIFKKNITKCSYLLNDSGIKSRLLITLTDNISIPEFLFSPLPQDICVKRHICKEVNSQELASRYARSLIEASLDPLFTISPAGKITDMNNASVKVTGLSRDKLINTDFYNYFTEPDKAQEVYKQVFEFGYVCDYPLVIKDHKFTDVLINGSIYKDEYKNVIGAVVVARDITEQKKIQHELIEAKIFAEEAKDKAEEAVKSKQQFLSNMSHEIRTPMNAIIGFTKVVLKTDLTEKQKEYLTAIKISGDSLIVLINDILDLAKVDAGKMIFEMTPFKLKNSISTMLNLFEPKIQEKNLKLIRIYDEKIPDILIGDSIRLNQIILNLLSNAVKFTHNGEIKVAVNLAEETEDEVTIEFSVEDTGIGIPHNKIESIFENFQQATIGTSRLYGGTGLGLAIVKKIIESQGGTINVNSLENIGTCFNFKKKFAKTNSTCIIDIPTINIDETIKNISVLVVEDIPLNQLLMKTLLDDFEFGCEIAENGRIAIEKLKLKNYDIVLMDLQMPEMNGFDATSYIRNVMKSNIPIIALTADVTTVDLEKCVKVGMNDYIAKPIDENLLYNKIVRLLKKKEMVIQTTESKSYKSINLDYLNTRTKSNKLLMSKMITLYLEQTPILIESMKRSIDDNNWETLHAAVHKIIPSFSIVGINSDFEEMAKQIKTFAENQNKIVEIKDMVSQLEVICQQACEELELELIELNKF